MRDAGAKVGTGARRQTGVVMVRPFPSLAALALVAACVLPLSTTAATSPVNDPALVAAAKREGTVTLYIAMEPKQLAAMVKRFEDVYGLNVQFLRLESDKLPPRVIVEDRGPGLLHNADVVADPDLQIDIELLKQLGLLVPLPHPPEIADFWPARTIPTAPGRRSSSTPRRSRTIRCGCRPPDCGHHARREDLAAKEWRGAGSPHLYANRLRMVRRDEEVLRARAGRRAALRRLARQPAG